VEQDRSYRIIPGDELELHFFHTPDRNLTVLVRPDGFVALPLVNELRVAGRTPEEVRLDLLQRYSGELASPEVAVIVRSFARYPVHVGGEVERPGIFEVRPSSTVLEAVFEAGGMLESASPRDALVVRRIDSGGYELIGTDLDAVLAGRDASGNLALRPYDIVYLPARRIAKVNEWIDMYIRQNIPLTFSYRLDG
jgi:polysaccharide export outer membrane protein